MVNTLAFIAGDTGLIPCQGTKTLPAMSHRQKKKKHPPPFLFPMSLSLPFFFQSTYLLTHTCTQEYLHPPGLFTTEFSFTPCIRGSSLKANRLSSKVSSLGREPKAAQPLGRDTPDLNRLRGSGRESELAQWALSLTCPPRLPPRFFSCFGSLSFC